MRLQPPHPNFGHHPPMDAEMKKIFLEFVRQVSPTSDPNSIALFGQIVRASNQLTQAAEKHLDTAGLSSAKLRLLTDLHRAEKHGTACMQPSQLSAMQGISRNTVSALIGNLEKDGLIHRDLHATDHRRFLIRLTPKGRKLLNAKLDSQFQFVSRCFEQFSAEERKTLLDMLRRLNEELEKNRSV